MQAQNILKSLVSFPVLGGQSNLSILSYIQSILDDHGVSWSLVPNEDGQKASLHCRIGPDVDGGVILSGHMDVVPVEGQDWESDPFSLIDKGDGKLYGRGSCDMKGFIACTLAALPQMIKAPLKKPIYFAFSYDEEIGCLAAPELARAIRDGYEETPAYAIIGEPSRMQPIVGQKGICIFETTVHGSAGHSSRIRTEVSAIHEAAKLILWLENKMNSLIEAGHIDNRFSPNHTSLHSGIMRGGIAPNVIADKCTFTWDARVIPADDTQQILAEFEAYCRILEGELQKRFKWSKITTTMHHPIVPALDTPTDLAVVELIKNLSGRSDLGAVSYAAEAGQFAEVGFQSVICGPGDIAQAHRANEFIEVDQLVKGVEFQERLIHRLCQ